MSTIAKLEAANQDGKKGPRLDTARVIAGVLGVHVDDLWPEGSE
jgi:DNA-binding XRE family transcriptional regulator